MAEAQRHKGTEKKANQKDTKNRSNIFLNSLLVFVRHFVPLCLCASLAELGLAVSFSPNAFGDQIEHLGKGLQRHQLDNGIVCLIKEDATAPLVSIQIWVGVGSAGERDHPGGGLSHLVEHMIFKGTPKRKPADIARQIDDVGGSINAYTSFDRTVFWVDMPAEHWQTGLDVLADALMHASFPEDEWRRERDVVRREMAMGNDNPDTVLSRLLCRTAFRVHPYRFPVIGLEDIFNSLTRDDLAAFFRRNYTPDNMIIAVVGSVKADIVRAGIENLFKETGDRARPLPAQITEPPQLGPRTARKTGVYDLSRLEMAWHTVGLSHPDAPALDMLSIIAGSGKSSRLSQKIKEDLKLAYTIDAWSWTPKDTGLFGINASFDPAKEKELIKAIETEVDSWRTNSFSPAEVEKARNKTLANSLLPFQTTHGQADTFALGEFYAGTPFYFDIYLKRLSEVTPQSLTNAASRYLNDQNRTMAVLSPSVTNSTAAEIEGRAGQPVPPAGPVGQGCPTLPMLNINKTVFPNGLTLLCREDRRLPFVNICVVSLGGLLLENEKNNGITALMAELMTRGTEKRTQEQIAEGVEAFGGSFSAFSGINSYGLQARCFSKDAGLFLDIMADCLLNPAFPEDEIVKHKTIQAARIDQLHESPMFLAQEAMRKALFAGHPYRLNVEGTRASVMAITREELLNLHAKTATGSNTVLAVFGDMSPAKARELTEGFMGKMAAGHKHDFTGLSFPTCPREAVTDRESRKGSDIPDSSFHGNDRENKRHIDLTSPREQTIVLAGFPGLAITDKRVDALNTVLESLNGLSADLMIKVRDKEGLAYYTGAYHKTGVAGGQFVLYSGTCAEAGGRVLAMMKKEIARLAENGLRADEFERARLQIISEKRRQCQDNAATALECALNELNGLGYAHGLEIEKRMEQLTREDIRATAAEILRPERMIEVIVRPAK